MILLLSTSDQTGGAAVAASRLMHALKRQGVEVKMLVRDKRTDNPDVVSLNGKRWNKVFNWVRFVWERLVIFICNRFSKKNLFQVSIDNTGTDISRHQMVQQADVIHLHWINQGMLSIQDIKGLISLGKPIVWTLHDMWPATSICHYAADCKQYQSTCQHCPMLIGHPLWNLARQTFQKKQDAGFSKIHFIGCSRWIVSVCQESALLRDAQFRAIPNPIDTTVFHPYSKQEIRERKGLPTDKKLVLFAAAKVSDARKGAGYLVDACQLIADKRNDVEILLMGGHAEELQALLPIKAHALGYLSSPKDIAEVYASADAFVTPSLEDNLPNTLMESLACGTPCVGFRTGGIPEMIEHKKNGYVAEYGSAEDLARGIQWVLDYPDKEALSRACVEKVEKEYAEEVVTRKYLECYQYLCRQETKD